MLNPREVLRKLRSPGLLLILGAMVFVLGAKFLLIQRYGSDLPFWDQWDAEADRLYIPAEEGRLHASEFFAPHNEHRIAFTKAVAFSLLRLNGQWDARVQMTLNAFLHVAAIALLLIALSKEVPRSRIIAAVFLSLALFALPLSWENTLAGFQSQFYFLLLFSILHLAGTFLYRPGSTRSWFAQSSGLCGVFSMASGFFSAAVVVAGVALRCCIRRSITRGEGALLAWNAGLIVLGLSLMTPMPGHEVLKSHSVSDLIDSFSLLSAWPSPSAAVFPLTLFPIGWAIFRRRKAGTKRPPLRFLFALTTWWLLQVAAIAYARGGDGRGMSPRYFDTLAIGPLVALLFWLEGAVDAVRSPRLAVRLTIMGLGVAWLAVVVHGFRTQTVDTKDRLLPPLAEVKQSRIDTVASFVASGDRAFFRARPWADLPYPNAERLGQILSNTRLKALLPSSVRPSLPVSSEIGGNTGFVRNGPIPNLTFPAGRPGWSSFERSAESPARFRSRVISPPKSRYVSIRVTGQLSPSDGSLYLETPAHREQIEAPAGTDTAWKTILIGSPDTPFRVVAECNPGRAFAFTEPVEVALGSVLVRHVLRSGALLCWLGGLIMFSGLLIIASKNIAKIHASLCALWKWTRPRPRLLTLVGAALILLLRKTDVWVHPQFWAEDGQIFFEQAIQLGSSAFFTPYAGYHHFLLRIVANFATTFDIVWAPAIYVYASILITLAVCALSFSPRINLPFKPLLALAIVLVPQNGEVFLNLTNLQWITALALLLVALKSDSPRMTDTLGDAAIVLVAGITGPFSILLLPLFALRVFRYRSKTSVVVLVSAGIAAAIQIEALIYAPATAAGVVHLWDCFQIVGYRSFARLFVSGPFSTMIGLPICATIGWLIGGILLGLSALNEQRRWELVAMWSALLIFLAAALLRFRGMEELLLQYQLGDRYFFVPLVIVSWILISIAPDWRRVALTAGIVALIANLGSFRFPPYENLDWKAVAHQIKRGEAVHVVVNPTFVTFDHSTYTNEDKAGSRGRFGEHVVAYITVWAALGSVLLGQMLYSSARYGVVGLRCLVFGLAGTCTIAYAVFWAYLIGPYVGLCVLLLSYLGSLAILLRNRVHLSRLLDTFSLNRHALTVSSLIGLAYIAVLHLYGSQASIADLVEERFLYFLPAADRFPGLLSEQLLRGDADVFHRLAERQYGSGPGVQTGIVLLGSVCGRVLQIDARTLSQAAGLWFQLLWVPALWFFAHSLALSRIRTLGIVLVASSTGFYVVNSAFVWPKIGAAALLFCAFCLCFQPAPKRIVESAVCGLLIGLACASDAAVAVSGISMLIVSLLNAREIRWKDGAAAGIALLITLGPWLAFGPQFSLRIPENDEGVLQRAIQGHAQGRKISDAPPEPSLSGRITHNVRLTAAGHFNQITDLEPEQSAARRASQFYLPFLTLWHWNLAWLLLPWVVFRFLKHKSREQGLLIACLLWGVLTYLIWIVIAPGGNSARLDQSSYAMTFAWFAFLLSTVAMWNWRVFTLFAAYQLVVFITTWLPREGFAGASMLTPALSTLVMSFLGVSLCFLSLVISTRKVAGQPSAAPEIFASAS